jgi:hypothetical protein
MNAEFEHLGRAAAGSRGGQLATRIGATVPAAWGSSAVGRHTGALRSAFRSASTVERLRWIATSLAVAGAGHLVLRTLMPPTVAPALPAVVFAGIVAIGGAIAWFPEAFVRAWRDSRLARAIASTTT